MSIATLSGHDKPVSATPARHRCALVIGGGISGLACAARLRRSGLAAAVLESSERPGGVMTTEHVDGFLLEMGPNSVLLKPEFGALVEELGLNEDLLATPMRDHARFVFKRGHGLIEVPTSALAFARTPLLSWRSKLRLMREPFLFRRIRDEITVADFARHHLGREMAEMLIAPFVSGVYAGDPERMSLQGALPRMVALSDRGRGSLTRGAVAKMLTDRRAKGSRPKSSLCSFGPGMRELPETLARELGGDFHPGVTVTSVELVGPQDGRGARWRIGAHSHTEGDVTWTADALAVATPAHTAQALMSETLPDAAEALGAIPCAPVCVIHLGVPNDSLAHAPRGFGFLVPRGHGPRILGALWTSAVFGGRAPEDCSLLTVFCGGATDPEAVRLSDQALMAVVEEDLRTAMGWDGHRSLERITRHERGLPQYLMGHVDLVQRIEGACALSPAPVEFVGNHMHGVSVSDCIRLATDAAEALTLRMRAAR